MIKDCKLATNNVMLLARENQHLRAVIEQESYKSKRSTKHNRSVNMEEAPAQVPPVAKSSLLEACTALAAWPAPTSPPRKRAGPTCND